MKTSGQNHQNVCIVTFLICVIQVYGASLIITQYPQYPTASSSAILTCHISSFSSSASAEWFMNGGSSQTLCFQGYCDPSSIPGYQFSIDGSGIHVTILNVDIALDQTNWTCQYDGTAIGSFILTVYTPVGSVQVKNGTNLSLIESQSAVLVCETDACKPSAAIYWMKNGINITDSPTSVNVTAVKSNMFVSIGTLNYTGQRGDNQKLLTCGAFNGLGSVKASANLTITIYYPPFIQGLTSPYKVIENQPLNVTCLANSNPPADLIFWSPRGEGSVNSTVYISSVSRNKSGIYSCIAQNTMIPTDGTQQIGENTSQILVDVLYPPSIQGLKSLYKVIEKQPLNVTCEVNSNPTADKVSWSPRGEGYAPSILYFQSLSRTISGNYSCTAKNNMTPTAGTHQIGISTSQIQVDVLYPPSIQGMTSPYKVIENLPLNVTCFATSNPPADWIIWSPRGEGSINSILYFSSVSRNKSGLYNCTAHNTMTPTDGPQQIGTATSQIQVDVLYGARISNLSVYGGNTINENSSAIFNCRVDSNPPSTITWMKESTVLKTESGVVQSNYTIESAECMENYTCSADNGIWTTAIERLELFVRCHPRTDLRLGLETKLYGKRHKEAILRYTVIAYPPPTFTWTFLGNGSESRALPASASQHDNGQQSELRITNLDITDFGNYSVIANNSLLPSATVVFEIIQADVPDVPSNVTIIEIKQTSVKVQWMAGYDGGPQQTFHIVASAGNSTQNITADDPGYKQNGTAVLEGLLPGTKYSIYVVAINLFGPSNITPVISVTTLKEPDIDIPKNFPLAAVAGSIGSGVGVILVAALVVFLVRRYRYQKPNTDGLVDNPVYDTSGPLPGPSASAGIAEADYAKVNKPKKKASNMNEPSNIYAQVNKTKKNFKKDTDKGKHGNMSRGDIYENAADLVVNTKAEPCDESLYEDARVTGSNGPMKNKDGLHYADLMLGPPSKKDGKDIIRGIENRTEYAEIAYGKRGEPLSDSDN